MVAACIIVDGDPGLQYTWSSAAFDSIYIYVGNLGMGTVNNELDIELSPNPFQEGFQIISKKGSATAV